MSSLESRVTNLESGASAHRQPGGCPRCCEGSDLYIDCRFDAAAPMPTTCPGCGRDLSEPPRVRFVRLVYEDRTIRNA